MPIDLQTLILLHTRALSHLTIHVAIHVACICIFTSAYVVFTSYTYRYVHVRFMVVTQQQYLHIALLFTLHVHVQILPPFSNQQ